MSREPERFDEIHAEILESAQKARWDGLSRARVIKKMEALDTAMPRRIAVYYARQNRPLSHTDILPFVSMLKSVGVTANLDLVVVSPGGDGTAAEKILGLCRRYCTKQLRVVVPLYAKSAATLLALGADEILMGETSELGPIDAQVDVLQDGLTQQVSADHFLRAKRMCIHEMRSSDKARAEAAQIQLTLLSPAFLQHCQDLMNFSRKFAKDQLWAHMFREELKLDATEWDDKIEKIVKNLTASSKHLLHGRMITADDISKDNDLKYLKVKALARDDPYWKLLNQLLLRTEISSQLDDFGKMLFAQKFQLVAG